MTPVVTTETTVRAAAHSAEGFIAWVDPHSGIVILVRGRAPAAELAPALPAAIAAAAAERVPAEPGSEAAAWPEAVRSVIAFLGAVHHDLRADLADPNGRGEAGRGPNALDILVGLPAGDRLHVVAAGGVVGFRAHAGRWERLAPLGERARRPLGVDSKARIEVTSEPYALGDLILALPDAAAAAGIAAQPPLEIARAIAAWAGAHGSSRPSAALGAYAVLGWAPAFEPGPPPAPARDGAPSIFDLPAWNAPPAVPVFRTVAREPALSDPIAFSARTIPERPAIPELATVSELEAELEALPELAAMAELEAIPELEMLSEAEPLPLLPVVHVRTDLPSIHDLPAISELDPPAETALETPFTPPSAAPKAAVAGGLLPEWLLERAAKDLVEAAGRDEETRAPELGPLSDDLIHVTTGSALTSPAGRRHRPRQALAIGLALVGVIGLGVGWRTHWFGALPIAQNKSAKTPAGKEERASQAATSGLSGPNAADLLGGARPWQRVVAGEGAARAVGAPPSGAVAGRGRIEARTEPFLPNVLVTIDGKPIGKAPVSMEGLEPGTHLVGFDGGNGRRWEEEVTVIAGDVAVAVAPLGAPATQGLVEVLATTMHDDGPADEEVKVLVNGEVSGATPLELTLDPGVHSIALDLGGERLIHRVIEVRSGDRQVLEVPVDVPPPFRIQHRPAASLVAEGTAILTVDVKGPAGTATYLDLRVEENGVFTSFPMGPVPGAPGTYAVGLPISRERHGKRLRYYFATAAEGELPVVTKIFAVPLR